MYRPISRYEKSKTEIQVKSSYDQYLEKVEKATGETKFIYHVTNENSAVGKKGVLFNQQYFLSSKIHIFKAMDTLELSLNKQTKNKKQKQKQNNRRTI